MRFKLKLFLILVTDEGEKSRELYTITGGFLAPPLFLPLRRRRIFFPIVVNLGGGGC